MESLQAEYRRRLAADPSQTTTDWAWLWYLKELYALDASPGIFELCQQGPKNVGLANLWKRIKEELSDRELYDVVISGTMNLYAENLLGVRVINTDLCQSRDFVTMAQEIALETVKAFRPLRGLPVDDDTHIALTVPASTLWHQLVDRTHKMAGLPRVRELKNTMRIDHPLEVGIRDSDDFTAYALTDRERVQLKRDLGIR